MLFNSFQFAIFLPVVLIVYYSLSHRKQNIFLLMASCIFYASWDWRFLFPLLFSTSIDYYCARRMETLERDRRRLYLTISIVTNIGLLGFFKYFNFFLSSMHRLLDAAGLNLPVSTLNIILPIGISFYTFQALSYTIDVYRGQMHSTRHFHEFLLAVLYFPHLVAGPIQRANNLLPQVTNPRVIKASEVAAGINLMVSGYFKKVFIADNLAPIVNSVFSSHSPDGFHVLFGVYAFAFQIYCDFSGYTDIARGIAKLMGFEFVLNFNLPYFAASPSDFWSRWHISLSTWLRDYLYIPLGGNRKGARRTYVNLMLTMVIGGLWHGAAWNFVLWGIYHGSLLVLQRAWTGLSGRFGRMNLLAEGLRKPLAIFVMFQCTCYGWLLFRAGSLHQIVQMTRALMNPFEGADWPWALRILALASPLIVVQLAQYSTGKLYLLRETWPEARVAVYAVLSYFILFLGGQPQAFIYFQF